MSALDNEVSAELARRAVLESEAAIQAARDAARADNNASEASALRAALVRLLDACDWFYDGADAGRQREYQEAREMGRKLTNSNRPTEGQPKERNNQT